MNQIDTLLGRLDKVKSTGSQTWISRCPAHADKTPSMTIKETDDGRVLIHCFSGCSYLDILDSVGLETKDLFPPRVIADRVRPERRPFPAEDILQVIGLEVQVVAIAAGKIKGGAALTDDDTSRLSVAYQRLDSAINQMRKPMITNFSSPERMTKQLDSATNRCNKVVGGAGDDREGKRRAIKFLTGGG